MCHSIYSVLSSTLQSAIAFNAKPVKVRCLKYFVFAWILVCVFLFPFRCRFIQRISVSHVFFFSLWRPLALFWILFDLLHCVSFICFLLGIYSCGLTLHMIRLLWKYLRFFVCFIFVFTMKFLLQQFHKT